MIHPLPDAVPTGPLACTSRCRSPATGCCVPPRDGDPVLIVGAGIIGLAAVAASRGCSRRARSRCWLATRIKPTPPWRAGPTTSSRAPKGAHLEQLAICGARVVGRKRPDAHGRLPLRGRGRGRAAVGDRVAACRGAPRDGAPARGRRGQRGRPDAHLVQGGRAGRIDRPHGRRRSAPGLAGGPDATRWTGPSTSWRRGCCPTRSW